MIAIKKRQSLEGTTRAQTVGKWIYRRRERKEHKHANKLMAFFGTVILMAFVVGGQCIAFQFSDHLSQLIVIIYISACKMSVTRAYLMAIYCSLNSIT